MHEARAGKSGSRGHRQLLKLELIGMKVHQSCGLPAFQKEVFTCEP